MQGKLYILLDADCSYIPEEITIALEEMKSLQGKKAFFSIRSRMNVNFGNLIRKILSTGTRTFLQIGWGNAPKDTQSGFKIFPDGEYLDQIIDKKFQTRWFYEWEILVRLREIHEAPTIFGTHVSYRQVAGSHIGMKSIPRIFREILLIKGMQIKTKYRLFKNRYLVNSK